MHLSGSKNSKIVRPTTDKVRLAIFSMIFDDIHGAKVLDLFAGSGSLGLESLSRGAKSVVFVDKHTALVEHNIRKMNASPTISKGQVSVVQGDIFTIRRFNDSRMRNAGTAFDLIFIDPPYGEFPSDEVLGVVARHNLLSAGGVIVYEESARSQFTVPAGFEVVKERRYGDTVVRFVALIDTTAEGCFGAFLHKHAPVLND